MEHKGPVFITKHGEEVKVCKSSHLQKLVTKEDPFTAEEPEPPSTPCATSNDILGVVTNGDPDSGTQTPGTGATDQNTTPYCNTRPTRKCNPLWWKWLTRWQRTFTAITANHHAGTGTVDSWDDAMARPKNTHNYAQYYLSARKTMCRTSYITRTTYP